MTLQAFSPEVRCRLGPSRLNMGVMTRDAPQSAVALLRAPAHLHLFRMAERSDDINLRCPRRAEDGNHVIQQRPGPEVQVCLAGPQDLRISEKVALLAHIL